MKYKEYKIEDFVEILSSKSSMPGGGTASALLSANATALSLMVLNLTIGKEKFKDIEQKLLIAKNRLTELKEIFLNIMDEDAEEFKVMENAYAMPKNNDEEIKKKNIAMEEACKHCCIIPKKLIELSKEGLNITNSLFGITTKTAESDLITAKIFYKAAIKGSLQNILINLKYIKDKNFITDYNTYICRMGELCEPQ